jgi:hypothetical protein
VGFGDQILAATTGTAAAAGSAAGLILAAPIAVVDQDTRDNYADQVAGLSGSKSGTKKIAGKDCSAGLPPTKRCD